MRRELLEELWRIPTASLSDALDNLGIRGFMDYDIKLRTADAKIVGFAVTIKDVPSEKKAAPLKALEAIDNAKKGDILVRAIENAEKTEICNIGLFGGIMALGCKKKGLAGAVIEGGVRDISECYELKFPVFARSVVPTTSVGRTEVVGVNVPVKCGGVIVEPDDVIVGDLDGVVVIPKEKLNSVVEAARKIDELEKNVAADLMKKAPLTETVKKHSRI
ncbi:RraA family protein [Candidatus Bathyarchaeota archaeon]|nr:RraA family protein [Candidatus Bathyarchaeota archaeon]